VLLGDRAPTLFRGHAAFLELGKHALAGRLKAHALDGADLGKPAHAKGDALAGRFCGRIRYFHDGDATTITVLA